ncbi:MAG: hypothetical protein OEZ22_08020 [Spirochaetia bacterium]|nr:hypothetical protein [Spirochaetia bacterium]
MLCHNENYSCAACCGIYNLNLIKKEIKTFLTENTRQFLSLNILNQKEVYLYRKNRESEISKYILFNNIYVCIFAGWTFSGKQKPGCLLHPTGGPHKNILSVKNPQNYSFYGQSICTNYNCPVKEKNLFNYKFKTRDPLLLGQFAGNYNLCKILNAADEFLEHGSSNLLPVVIQYLSKNMLPVTSFEVPMNLKSISIKNFWDHLGAVLLKENYINEQFEINENAIKLGLKLKEKYVNT